MAPKTDDAIVLSPDESYQIQWNVTICGRRTCDQTVPVARVDALMFRESLPFDVKTA